MPLCWTSDWIFLGINFWELLMLWKLGNCWILEKKFQRSVALDERGGVYVLTHYQGAGCFSPARFVQCANKCTPPCPRRALTHQRLPQGALSLQTAWPLASLRSSAMGPPPPGSEPTVLQWSSASWFHQRPSLSGGTWPHIGINRLWKYKWFHFGPLFFPVEGAERERGCLKTGQDTCWGHEAFSNYPVVPLGYGWRQKRTLGLKEKKKKALIWEENHVMGVWADLDSLLTQKLELTSKPANLSLFLFVY